MSIRMEVWGDYACFTRLEAKADRVSYDVPTPSAARGMVESVYYHPGLEWKIDKIFVLAPIVFTNLRRNEVKSKVQKKTAYDAMTGNPIPLYLEAFNDIEQRTTVMLKDVHYVIEAHFNMTNRANAGDNKGKFQDIVKRRLRKGACYSQPYLGTRECTAHFRLWQDGHIPTIQETRDLGIMLYDVNYSDPNNIHPMFFRARMENGVIDLRNCEVME